MNTHRKNRNIVLKFLVQADCQYFKCKWLSKKITELTTRQIGNGLRVLRKEGYITKYNPTLVWKITEKLEKLRE